MPSATQEKPKDSDQFEWVTIEQSGELVYEAPESIAAEPPPINKQQSQSSSSSSASVQTMSPIPAHSLAAFGLFLRLPGYAEVLLKERKHAQCLLRLVLGVTDDGEGSKSESNKQLPTLTLAPFTVPFQGGNLALIFHVNFASSSKIPLHHTVFLALHFCGVVAVS